MLKNLRLPRSSGAAAGNDFTLLSRKAVSEATKLSASEIENIAKEQ